jgi:hypothetical protein
MIKKDSEMAGQCSSKMGLDMMVLALLGNNFASG